MGTNIIVTAIVVVYLLFMLWIGWYSSTKITSNTDFMVPGSTQSKAGHTILYNTQGTATADLRCSQCSCH